MITNDFFSFLNNDLEEAENMRMVKEQEEEKAMFSVIHYQKNFSIFSTENSFYRHFRDESRGKNDERLENEL